MSGRLVISRHKSWHVWNQDNREKVLRDERIHSEKIDAQEKTLKSSNQEYYLDLLKANLNSNSGSSSSSKGIFNDNLDGGNPAKERMGRDNSCQKEGDKSPGGILLSGSASAHVVLFEDPTDNRAGNLKQNEEYLKDKAAKELKEKKSSGIAPWSNGQLFRDVIPKKDRPWYTLPSAATSGSSLTFKGRPDMTLAQAIDRDNAFKSSMDPMASILKYDFGSPGYTVINNFNSSSNISNSNSNSNSNASKRKSDAYDTESKTNSKKAKKERKKEKKRDKKRDKKKEKKERGYDDSSSSSDDASSDDSKSESSSLKKERKHKKLMEKKMIDVSSGSSSMDASVREELRQRRLKREADDQLKIQAVFGLK